MRQAIVLAAMGMATGLVLSAGLSHALRSQLFGVSTLEPWVYLSTTGVLAGAVLLASLAPTIRAIRLSPLAALRTE
jgi:putative ABC transport system permease protein